MELVISIALGLWISLSGVVCYLYFLNDKNREKRK